MILYYVWSLFLYLEKAFDAIDHQILSQTLPLWYLKFSSYLSNRQQFFFISVCSSELIQSNVEYLNDLNSVFNKAITIHFAD